MTTIRQLYQLQEIDEEIASREQSLRQKNLQLGARRELDEAQQKLDAKQQQLDALQKQQRSLENDIDDLTSKISAAEGQLYGGKIRNSKELSSLQQEVNLLKGKREQKENEALETMDRVEATGTDLAASVKEFRQLEAQWRQQQEQLAEEIARIEENLAELKQQRATAATGIDPQSLETYESLRQQKGQAVARVAQGICHTCRISLSSSQLQRARGNTIVHCSSCGRILYLP
ncbi:zinc ribbon domain-containing protein [Chloroflexota bacterium]